MDVPYPNEPDLSLESLLKQCLLLWYYYADKIAFWLLVHITVQIIRKKGKDYDLAPFLNLVTKQQQQQQKTTLKCIKKVTRVRFLIHVQFCAGITV